MGRTRARAAAGLVLDTGALIALERRDKRTLTLLRRASLRGVTFRVPAGVLGQAWRDGRVQATLARFLRSEDVEIVPLDEHTARGCGELCRAANSRDVIDASVVFLTRARREPIVASDPDDLRRLDAGAEIIAI